MVNNISCLTFNLRMYVCSNGTNTRQPPRPEKDTYKIFHAYEEWITTYGFDCVIWIYISVIISSCRVACTDILTLSRHVSLSFFASSGSSGLHPVSSHSYWIYVRAGRPDFARQYGGLNRSISLMSSSMLLEQCPACLFRLSWIVFVMRGRKPCSRCFVGCCRQDLFIIACNILV